MLLTQAFDRVHLALLGVGGLFGSTEPAKQHPLDRVQRAVCCLSHRVRSAACQALGGLHGRSGGSRGGGIPRDPLSAFGGGLGLLGLVGGHLLL